MTDSGLVHKESFQDKLHPRFFAGIPVMPWKRKFYCEFCDKTITGLANVDSNDHGFTHRVTRSNSCYTVHPVEEVTNE